MSKPRVNAFLQYLKSQPNDSLDVDARDEHGRTPLHYAAVACNPDVMELLLQHGADVTATDNHGVTTLHFATYSPKCTAVAVEHGCEVDKAHAQMGTPLQFSRTIEYSNTKTVHVLEGILGKLNDNLGPTRGDQDLPNIETEQYEDLTRWMISKRDEYSVLCRRNIKHLLDSSQQNGCVQLMAERDEEEKKRERLWNLVYDSERSLGSAG